MPNGSKNDFDNSSNPLKKSVIRPQSGIDRVPRPEYRDQGESQTIEQVGRTQEAFDLFSIIKRKSTVFNESF